MTFGGPIKKDKTFFFISYEGLRQLQSTTQQFTVPRACAHASRANRGCDAPYQQRCCRTPSPQMCQIMQAYPVARIGGDD